MGFDITLHPFSTKEFKYYFEDVLNDSTKIESRLEDIHSEESERDFIRDALYSRLAPLKSKVMSGELEFENSIGFGMGAIFGFLHPYWYSRNGLLSRLFELELLKRYVGTISDLVSDENKELFEKSNGELIGNYSSGIFIPSKHIDSIIDYLKTADGQTKAIEIIDAVNLNALMTCLNYCASKNLHILELSDLVVPFTGTSNTYPNNFRAKHLKNVENQDNDAKNKKLEN